MTRQLGENFSDGLRKAIKNMIGYEGSGFSVWVYADGSISEPHTNNTEPHPESEKPIISIPKIEMPEDVSEKDMEGNTKEGYFYVLDEGWIDKETVIDDITDKAEEIYKEKIKEE